MRLIPMSVEWIDTDAHLINVEFTSHRQEGEKKGGQIERAYRALNIKASVQRMCQIYHSTRHEACENNWFRFSIFHSP